MSRLCSRLVGDFARVRCFCVMADTECNRSSVVSSVSLSIVAVAGVRSHWLRAQLDRVFSRRLLRKTLLLVG